MSKANKSKDIADAASHRIKEAADQVEAQARDATHSTRQAASRAVETGADHAYALQGEFDTAVRRNPTFAVLGALGVGLLVGITLSRRA